MSEGAEQRRQRQLALPSANNNNNNNENANKSQHPSQSKSRRCCKCLNRIALLLLPIALLVLATFLGGFLFHIIEEPIEIQRVKDDPSSGGYPPITTKWSFWNSFWHSICVYTTIGYDTSAETKGGRVFTVAYFTITFPILLWTISEIGKLLAAFALLIQRLLIGICCSCRRRRQWQRVSGGGRRAVDSKNQLIDEDDFAYNNAAISFPLTIAPFVLIGWLVLGGAIIYLIEHERIKVSKEGDMVRRRDPTYPHYWECVWFFFRSQSTIGFRNDLQRLSPEIVTKLCTMVLVLLGGIVIAMFYHVIVIKTDAVEQTLLLAIDERYKRALLIKDAAMPVDDRGVRKGLKALLTQQPCSIRFYYYILLSAAQHKNLKLYWMKKGTMQSQSNQTRESSFEPRMYGIGSNKDEFRKSRDDVNSLVAALDYPLRPQTHRAHHSQSASQIISELGEPQTVQ